MMPMKNAADRRPLSLFAAADPVCGPPDFQTRLCDFARASAARRRGAAPDRARFVAALRAYHRTWTICSREPVPPLDDAALACAVATYRAAVQGPAAPDANGRTPLWLASRTSRSTVPPVAGRRP
jgi:hypothetical protein